MKRTLFAIGLTTSISIVSAYSESGPGWVSFPGGNGPGQGKHVVLLAGDEEYRSEEAMPMLAKILSTHHGFKCTVLFSANPDGTINPNLATSLENPQTLNSADAIVMSIRFRKWSDDTMKIFDAAIQRGIPIVGLRTSTHAFQLPPTSAFKQYNSFGKDVLGEKWVSHWGNHKSEATRSVVEAANAKSPLLQGVGEIFGDSDVYEAHPPADATILLRGQVLSGMSPTDAPAVREKPRSTDKQMQDVNTPMMPIAWTREVKNASGKTNKVLCTTMGAATDLADESLRRLVVNGVFYGLDLPVPAKANVTPVGEFQPSKYSNNLFKKGKQAADLP